MLLNARWQFGNILLLGSYDRISSFYWIRGSQHCFLTKCSYLNCYYLFLVFSCNSYLLVFSCLSWLRGNPISHPIFYTFGSPSTTLYMCPHISGTHHTFSRSKTLVGTWYKNKYQFFPRYAFPQRFLLWTSIGWSQIMPYSCNFHELTFSCMT